MGRYISEISVGWLLGWGGRAPPQRPPIGAGYGQVWFWIPGVPNSRFEALT